jgi:hypothetical protein
MENFHVSVQYAAPVACRRSLTSATIPAFGLFVDALGFLTQSQLLLLFLQPALAGLGLFTLCTCTPGLLEIQPLHNIHPWSPPLLLYPMPLHPNATFLNISLSTPSPAPSRQPRYRTTELTPRTALELALVLRRACAD